MSAIYSQAVWEKKIIKVSSFLFFFLAASASCGSTQGKDQTRPIAGTCTMAEAMPDLSPAEPQGNFPEPSFGAQKRQPESRRCWCGQESGVAVV